MCSTWVHFRWHRRLDTILWRWRNDCWLLTEWTALSLWHWLLSYHGRWQWLRNRRYSRFYQVWFRCENVHNRRNIRGRAWLLHDKTLSNPKRWWYRLDKSWRNFYGKYHRLMRAYELYNRIGPLLEYQCWKLKILTWVHIESRTLWSHYQLLISSSGWKH